MFYTTLRDLARPQVVAIVDVLKRSDGLAVGDIADALNMSYMGVKQYCVELEKRGYLDTWRRAKETGRPELTYRLTPKAQVLFPQQSTDLTMDVLEALRQLHGPTAVEKILFQYFLKKSEAYAKRIKGKSIVERAVSLAKIRDHEGHCVQVDHDSLHGLRLTEYHNPLADLMKDYPSMARMEESMMSKLLQAPVQRDLSAVSGLMRITFLVAGATLPPPVAPARPRPKKPKTRECAVEPATEPETPKGEGVETTSVEMTGVETNGVEETGVEETSVETTSVEETSVETTSVEEPSFENPSVETTGVAAAIGIEEFEPVVNSAAPIELAVQPLALKPAADQPALGADEQGETAAGQADASPESALVAVNCEAHPAPVSPTPAGHPAPTQVRVTEEAMLFDDMATAAPAPRTHHRAVTPSRPPKPQAPVAEELLLSL